ncbi:MAG: 2Fe-2S iron-sulfur cluster-binding protein [Planctomycetota bacterium]
MSDDRITITVDGEQYQVTPKQQLIEALWEAGIETPNFCFHPDLTPAGNCRICLVEVEGPRGWALMISCYMPVAPDMNVRTERSSEAVRLARKGVMEFLLVNHPLDCPICDKAGECTLQEHYMGQGQHESRLEDSVGKVYKGGPEHRFIDTKGVERGGKHIDLGPSIVLDQERCILCSRCVRFLDEVAGDEQLHIAGRGDHAYITTFPGDQLDHAYDLCTTDICPVGALTGKHFRFQQRVWFLKSIDSIAPDDSLGANLTIDYDQGRVWRLMPRRNPAVNKSWIHNDTRLLYRRLDENRLIGGLRDGNDCMLSEAYQAAGAAVADARKVAIVATGHGTVEDNAALRALAEGLAGRAELFGGSWLPVGDPDGIARSGDPVANRRGLELLGIPDNLDELVDRVDEFDCLLVVNHDLWGADADRARLLERIQTRIVLASWRDATVAAATIALGVRCWAEVRGLMINCHGRAQVLGACPVCPDHSMDPAWRAVVRLSGAAGEGQPLPWASELDALRAAADWAPALQGLNYRRIGPQGLVVAPVDTPVEA